MPQNSTISQSKLKTLTHWVNEEYCCCHRNQAIAIAHKRRHNFGKNHAKYNFQFLANLSRRLTGELTGKVDLRRPSSPRLFNHLLLRNKCTNQSLFHIELIWDGETKVCSNGPGHMTNMAAIPYMVNTITKSPEPKDR